MIDSGCTNHLCNDTGIFINLDQRITGKIKTANGTIVEAYGKSEVRIRTYKCNMVISNVLYVFAVIKNLLSVPQLIKSGYAVRIFNERCRISKNDVESVTVLLKN